MTTSTIGPHTKGLVLHWAGRYDLLVWLFTHGRERAFRSRLVTLARIAEGERVLDIGCGTGSLAMAAKRHAGAAGRVVGIDASPEMIERARTKAARAGVEASFQLAPVEALPFAGSEFDVVLSTLMLHHLPRKTREQGVREVRRVLKPGGRLLVVDFGKPQDKAGFLARFHRHGYVDPREIESLLQDAGFRIIESGAVGVSSLRFVLGSIDG